MTNTSRATMERQQALAEAFRLHASRAVEAHLATLAEGVTNEQMRASFGALLTAMNTEQICLMSSLDFNPHSEERN